MKDAKEKTKFLNSNLRAMNLWFAAGQMREVKQQEWKLSSAGVKVRYFEELLRGLQKTFRFNLYYEDFGILEKLEDYVMTKISSDEMYEEIYKHIKENEGKEV